ncbi:MAG: hypothetical protein JNN03_18240 [Rubrivivax sp.]|nr:hypothetical protein [Rubrivivax sp.]
MKTMRACPRPAADPAASLSPRPAPHPAPRLILRLALTATAAAALVACGGGGGGDPSAPANEAPTVALATPAANSTFTVGAAIGITATAADSDGSVARVEFYDGTTKLGEDTTAPFEFTWTTATAGAHTITARAVDNLGATAVSSSTSVTVNAAPSPPAPPPPPPPANQAPTVSITSPANNFKPNDPATITLTASAADADGSVAKVEFFRINPAAPVYDINTLVGVGTAVGTPPSYQRQTTLTAGTYTFAARATDNAGAVTTSSTVQVIVNALPAVAITSPSANATIGAGTNVTLRATASDADGSIAKVEFFLDGSATALGQATRVGTTTEYTLAWNNVPAGAHTLVARATDSDGATRSTASLSVNGATNAPPTVTLDVPTAGTNAPTTLTLTASAADSDGSVASVQFFNGATLLGNGTFDAATSKYRLQVPILANQSGTYTITARATDNGGAQTTTASRSITIAANSAPVVTVSSAATATLPVNTTTGPVTLAATASDTDGIAKVEFFNGATKLGEDTSAPYEFTWNGVAAGTYSVTARATDTVGSVTTSAVQSLIVSPNTEGLWATLNAKQQAGISLAPNRPVEAGGVDAVEVMTAIGVNTVIPAWFGSMAQAALALARALPANVTTGFVQGPCTTGTIQVAQAGANRLINLNNCVIGGFSFYGGAGVTPYLQEDTTTPFPAPAGYACTNVAGPPRRYYCTIGSVVDWEPITNGFKITIQGLRVTGNGAPHPGGKDWPRNAFTYTTVTCTGTGAAQSCITNLAATFLWGNDLTWAWTPGAVDFTTPTLLLTPPATLQPDPPVGFAIDDTHALSGLYRPHYCSPDPDLPNNGRDQCLANPPAARNIRFENFTHNSGRAIVYGNNGWAVVTRLTPLSPGVERVQVKRFLTAAVSAGGTTYPVGAGPTEIYRCAVGTASGDWECTLIP